MSDIEGISRDDTVHGESYFTAADMATASAQGFRDGVASVAANVGSEPVAWPKDATEVREFFRSDFIRAEYVADDHQPCDEDRYYISAHDFLSAINWWADFPHHPSPPEGMVGGWISVDERLPEPRQAVAFIVDSENWPTFKYLHRRVLGGIYLPEQGFSIPGLSLMASHWMPLPPAPPTTSAGSGKGE